MRLLEELKAKLNSGERPTVASNFYVLAKELGCLGELLGREYELIYEYPQNEGKIIGFRQKPMSIPSFVTLMDEMEKDYKRQEKEMKKSKKRK
jgi:hypothetical protein